LPKSAKKEEEKKSIENPFFVKRFFVRFFEQSVAAQPENPSLITFQRS